MRAPLLAAVLAVLPHAAEAGLRAERITEASAAELRIGGPDAIGGVGDWWLGNGIVEAVIDDVGREYGMLQHGGTLVDLGLAGVEGEDQFVRLVPMLNLAQRVVLGYDAARAEVDPEGRWARIVVTSPGLDAIVRGGFLARSLNPLVPDPAEIAAVRVETTYELRPGESFVRVTTTFTNTGDEDAPLFAFGDLWMRAGRGGRGFVGDAFDPGRARGFAGSRISKNARHSVGALTNFTHAALIGSPDFPPIAYALSAPERAARGLPFWGMFGQHPTLALAFVGDRATADVGLLALARAILAGALPAGEAWTHERRVRVVARRELAALTDAVLAEHGVLEESGFEGAVGLAGRRAALIVETPGGVPVTQLSLAGTAGTPVRFAASLPPGRYTAVLRAEHAEEQRVPLPIDAGPRTLVGFRGLRPAPRLRFAPAFADGGPGRIEVRGIAGTPDPLFGDDLLGATLDGAPMPSATASRALLFTGGPGDPREVPIAPGRYRLVATRGLDWEIASAVVEVPPEGAVAVPSFALEPLAALPGFASADLHVHGQGSHDTQVPDEERVRRYVAEGVDVLVATEHDNVPDYAPALARLGVGDRLRVVHGVEATTSASSHAAPWSIGHHNAWPVARVENAHRHGAPETQNRSVAALYAALRAEHGARVVQLNHPRPSQRGIDENDLDDSFFEHLGVGARFDPRRPLDAPEHAALLRPEGEGGTRALDFDAIEVMNGDSWVRYRAVREDWYALLRRGVRRTATANSDSHVPGELPAYPRNYVFVGPEGDAAPRFDAALREGRSFGTTGPRIRRLLVNGASLGELARAEAGRVEIAWEVDAASWVPVDEVRILVDGEVVHAGPGRNGTLDLPLERDAFVTLEAGAPPDVDPGKWIAAHPGPYTEVIAPGFVSAAFSNPVFVDVDGDGAFTAPGP